MLVQGLYLIYFDMLKGKLFIISGPSGVGKGTVIAALKKEFPNFVFPLSYTTRSMRPGEKDGEVYHFISKEEFEEGIKSDRFLEWAFIHRQNYYGTAKQPILDALEQGKMVLREVDVQGFHSIKALIPAENFVSIFLKAENEEELLERIAKRGKLSEEELARRMESARKELADAGAFDYQIVNREGAIEECLQQIKKIIMEKGGTDAIEARLKGLGFNS